MARETETLNGQTFDVLEPEDRPRDTYGDGKSLRFTTSEHDEMTMPQAIEVRDAQGVGQCTCLSKSTARSYDRCRRGTTNLSLAPAGRCGAASGSAAVLNDVVEECHKASVPTMASTAKTNAISFAARHRSRAVGRRLICCIKNS
jgi:hypothetical protein